MDQLLADIADYVVSYDLQSPDAVKNARYSLLDALGASPACKAGLTVTVPALTHHHRAPPHPQAARCWR